MAGLSELGFLKSDFANLRYLIKDIDFLVDVMRTMTVNLFPS